MSHESVLPHHKQFYLQDLNEYSSAFPRQHQVIFGCSPLKNGTKMDYNTHDCQNDGVSPQHKWLYDHSNW